MPRLHLVHGFNVSDGGKETTDRLRPYLENEGWTVTEEDYGWLGLLGVRMFNGRIASRVRTNVREGAVGVGHSNGCAILARAADEGAPLEGLVLINPALDADRRIAPHVRWIHVYYNEADEAVRVSRLLRFHEWGDMGARGYIGLDTRYRNMNCSGLVQGHSDIFTKLDTWAHIIIRNIRAELEPVDPGG